MDPLSFSANIIAIVDAATTVARKLEMIRSFKGASNQLLQVINEVSDIRTIFAIVQQTCTDLDANNAPNYDRLQELLLQTRPHFEFFDRLAQKIMPGFQSCNTGRRHWRLWVRQRENIQLHSSALRNIKRNIMEALAMIQVSNIPEVQVRLADIAYEQNETRQRFSSIQNNIEELQLMTNRATEIQPQLNDLQTVLQTLQRVPEVSRPSNTSAPQNTHPVIRIPTTVRLQQNCHAFCMCQCHRRETFASPSWMQHLIGSLFIGYAAIPTSTRPACNERRCVHRQSWLITVSYYFPLWLLHRTIFLKACSNPTDGCMISVRTPRVVSITSPQFLLSQYGKIVELQKLFSQGLASPFDVENITGMSCLQYAVSWEQPEICEFLLSQYADPYYVGQTLSCLGILWTREYSENPVRGLLPALHKMKEMFASFLEDYDVLTQELNLTTLHQIVLGLTNIDLHSQLSLSTADIDTRCSLGRTPLLWATLRSDINAMKLLLDFGASLDITDNHSRSVFHKAASVESPEPLKLLLDIASAIDMNTAKEKVRIPLLNQTDVYNGTPLHVTIGSKRTSHALLLLQYHCDINPSLPIISPLLGAIQLRGHEIIKCLLAKGARTDVVDTDQMGILHYAGGIGDHETLRILLQHEPMIADVTLADNQGRTPMQCFEQDRKIYVEEDEQLFSESRKVFELLLNKANSYQLQL